MCKWSHSCGKYVQDLEKALVKVRRKNNSKKSPSKNAWNFQPAKCELSHYMYIVFLFVLEACLPWIWLFLKMPCVNQYFVRHLKWATDSLISYDLQVESWAVKIWQLPVSHCLLKMELFKSLHRSNSMLIWMFPERVYYHSK